MMPRLPRSIFGLVMLASIALAVSTVLLGAVVYIVSHEALEQQLDRRIADETHHLRITAEQHGIEALLKAIERREDGHRTSEMGYMLFGPDGRKIAGRFEAARLAPGWHELLPFMDASEGEQETAQALVTPLDGGYTLVISADRTPIDEIDATIVRMFAIAFGSMLVIGVGCAWTLGLIVRRRLGHISLTAKAIIDGDLSRRVPHDASPNEFDRLAETLNAMLDRNEALLTNLQQVTSDIAHDLRTPLAQQKRALEAALEAPADLGRYRETIRIAADSGQEILDLFAALLRISEIESGHVREHFRSVSLADVVERVTDAFRASADESGHKLIVSIDDAYSVMGDRFLLAQMLANLVENALRHTPNGSTIAVTLKGSSAGAILSVADDGPGIAAEDRERVLNRFVRLDASRTTPGHGLGMSLVAAIAKAHFATLLLSGAAPGLRVKIIFAGGRYELSGPVDPPVRQ